MKDEDKDKFFIHSIFEEIKKIENFVENETYATFIKDEKLQYAIYKAFENIGEASKNISTGLKEKHTDIPWRELAGLRDKLSHGYFGIDCERIWEAVHRDVPAVKAGIEKLINE
ncbi:hypothetical protein AUJ66_01920 [Candidatus Desantisbacteria bacterium CG1_02_38_46]|uniref:DUF86 domain-containing protein n=3 Tax=unclassified Candidatus Desantisiibacteriota TaxID=3106372 RepID=A0A2H9PC37_9BACT|nr:MAG: hypothetical protein AUJ66_01920 [Candidatus Desantisbacteria bacterium CG1_02_38_46]PIU51730.1 MAG: DUF86 domain-containing protein [Candidatus Desantisbacteria bacterium CG07_land_8_20_14_0_80_39_15]PIZ15516.1 MAG: DUF86 domain-containing protein [Candidatus Desantisbacteria bacterium CG_4_10_14_0_8_um_filter_39_17]